jgi:hypothetical protein
MEPGLKEPALEALRLVDHAVQLTQQPFVQPKVLADPAVTVGSLLINLGAFKAVGGMRIVHRTFLMGAKNFSPLQPKNRQQVGFT